jgi:hypothetical protein
MPFIVAKLSESKKSGPHPAMQVLWAILEF